MRLEACPCSPFLPAHSAALGAAVLRAFSSARILFISQQNLLLRLTNCREMVPSSRVTDVSAGWRLMKIS